MVIVTASLVFAGSAYGQRASVDEFTRLLTTQYTAISRNDTSTLRGFFGDSLRWVIGANGAEATKAQLLAAVAQREDAPPDYAVDSVRVRQVGTAAVIEYRRTDTRRVGGVDIPAHWRVLAVYTSHGGRWQLERHIQSWVVTPAKRVAVDSAALGAFVGRYRVGPNNIDEVRWNGGHLVVKNNIERVGPELVPVSQTAFIPNGMGAMLVFERDSTGRVIGYVQAFPDGRVVRAVRLP
jgi:hypothetical protein